MRKRLGLLLVLIPAIASAAYVLNESAADADAPPAPNTSAPKTLVVPQSTSDESSETGSKPVERDDAHSQAPQQSPGEVIGIPMVASAVSARLIATTA